MLKVNHQVGRVVEVFGEGAISYDAFVGFRSGFLEKLARVQAPSVVVVGDLRGLEEMSDDVAPALLGMLRADNQRVERGGHVVKAGSAFQAQYARVLGATANPLRQLFTEPELLVTWLRPVLDAAELARVRALLGG